MKIPSQYAKSYSIKRGDLFTAHFANGYPSMQIKASGNGPYENGIQYVKQFEGVGAGACNAFTSWYQLCGIEVGDSISVEYISPTDVVFAKI